MAPASRIFVAGRVFNELGVAGPWSFSQPTRIGATVAEVVPTDEPSVAIPMKVGKPLAAYRRRRISHARAPRQLSHARYSSPGR